MDFEKIIDQYNDIHEAAYQYMRANPECLGRMQWLKPAIGTGDFQIAAGRESIVCYGNTYTTQTMSHESFEFQILYMDLKATLFPDLQKTV